MPELDDLIAGLDLEVTADAPRAKAARLVGGNRCPACGRYRRKSLRVAR